MSGTMSIEKESINALPPAALRRAAAAIKCVGHPLRLRILEGLEGGELTVTEIQELTDAPQAAVSRQLSILRGRDIVDCRREGVNVYYWVTDPKVYRILACIRACELGGEA